MISLVFHFEVSSAVLSRNFVAQVFVIIAKFTTTDIWSYKVVHKLNQLWNGEFVSDFDDW